MPVLCNCHGCCHRTLTLTLTLCTGFLSGTLSGTVVVPEMDLYMIRAAYRSG